MKKKVIGNTLYSIFIFILFVLSRLIYYAMNWSIAEYGKIPFGQIVFHLKVPLTGTSSDIIKNFINGFIKDSLIIIIAALVVLIVIAIVNLKQKTESEIRFSITLKKKTRNFRIKVIRVARLTVLILVVYNLVFDLKFVYAELGIGEYLHDMNTSSTIFEKYYVDPAKTEVTFPDKKKNLIYIFCESMEVTYSSKEYKGALDYNLIPNLSELAVENQCFSGNSYLNGASSVNNTTWTIAGMVSETAGIPLSLPISSSSYGEYTAFLPGAVTIGDILAENGYNNMLMLGSDATFGGRKSYFSQHGNYEIFDLFTARETGKIPDDYYVWWGYEDEKLFSYAKEAILELASQDEPFNFSMLTVDTHFQNGYVCNLCKDEYDNQIENVIVCSDSQIAEFVDWISQQDFYEDTVIVISGDHNNMSSTIPKLYTDSSYERKTYFNIINSDTVCENDSYRIYTRLDIYPTTLAALGCTIDGDRLGLGTNLYSDTKTLPEEISLLSMDEELKRNSKYYNSYILGN